MSQPITKLPSRKAPDSSLKHDWSRPEVEEIFQRPLLDLVFAAQQVHRKFHDPAEVQLCQLLSIKTGGCPEDCAYCPQSAHYQTGVAHQDLLGVEQVAESARKAHAEGATRFCMGAAWREVRDGQEFENVLEMVRARRVAGNGSLLHAGNA